MISVDSAMYISQSTVCPTAATGAQNDLNNVD